jgi:hypothetical protein
MRGPERAGSVNVAAVAEAREADSISSGANVWLAFDGDANR